MKKNNFKAILLAGTLALVSCQSRKECIPYQEVYETNEVLFDVGQHIISIPISSNQDVRSDIIQYDYYEGYEPVGISLTGYGKVENHFGGGSILYINVEKVLCTSNLVDQDGNYIYNDIGKTIYHEEDNIEDCSIKKFDIGMHIISVPITYDNRLENWQYPYHEGYEVVGIGSTAYGKLGNYFGGGVLLYKNIVPVNCVKTKNGYSNFGIPIEYEKVKTLE